MDLRDLFYWGIPEGAREELRYRRRDQLPGLFRLIQIGGIVYALFWISVYLQIPFLHGLRQFLRITASCTELQDCAVKVFHGMLAFCLGKFMVWFFRG